MVRDIVNRQVVAHFRAHTSPLLALQFDPSGTILVTASLHGHNVHIFHICPWQGTGSARGSGSARPLASAVHLYRLARGVTPAVIQDLSFSRDGVWLAVSSARGTTHIFRSVAQCCSSHATRLPWHKPHLICHASVHNLCTPPGVLHVLLPPPLFCVPW